jgi:drug/metabolite transporter (DMT)-like permease
MYIYAAVAMFFWGLSFVWVKLVYEYYGPLTTVFLRFIMASLILGALALVMRQNVRIERRDVKAFLLLAFFEPFCYFLGESYGLKYVSSTLGSLIVATIPLFTPFMAFAVLGEPLRWANMVGVVMSFVGITLMIVGKDLTLSASPLGILLMFFAVASALGYSLIVRKLSIRYSSLAIVFWQNILALVYFAPLFAGVELSHFKQVGLQSEPLTNIFLLALFPSCIAFYLWTSVIRELGVSRSAPFSNLIPLVTAFFSYIVLDEVMTPLKIIAVIIVVMGLFVSQIKFGKGAKAASEEPWPPVTG